MRLILIVVLMLGAISFDSKAQGECVRGDCENGMGVYIFANGDRYEGEFKDGKRSKGRYYWTGEGYYEGEWVNDKPHGEGRRVDNDGMRYEGMFELGVFSGRGVLTQSDGTVIVGNWKSGKLNGDVTVSFASGDRFIGRYENGQKNGPGIHYYLKGGELRGEWRNGEYISGSATSYKYKGTIDLKPNNGVYEVEVLVNDRVRLPFILDTGASIMLLTPDVLMTLVRAGTVSEDDILEGAHFVDANGDVNRMVRFRIRKVKLGPHEIEDVEAAVANNLEAGSLLGLSVIEKLGNIELDFVNKTMYSSPK